MPDVTIVLDKIRTLKFGIHAICSLEREFKSSIMELFPKQDSNIVDIDGNPAVKIEFNKLIGLLWAGIRHENRKLTPEDVEILVDEFIDNGGTIETVFNQVMEAFNNSNFLKGAMEVAKAKKKKAATQRS